MSETQTEATCEIQAITREDVAKSDRLGLVGVSRARRPIRILTLEQLAQLPPPRWRLEGMLADGQLSVLVGPPGAGKSFWCIGLSVAVATGSDWSGRPVRRGRVAYLAAEGHFGLRRRIQAALMNPVYAELSDEERELPNLRIIPEAVNLFDGGEDATLLVETFAQQDFDPDLVIIDTLARCAVGAEENATRDMGEVVEACDRIRATTGAHVLLVHHPPKGNPRERELRGAGALGAAADTVLSLGHPSKTGRLSLRCEKQKDAAAFKPIELRLEVVELGQDEDGAEVSSCRIGPGSGAGLVAESKCDPSDTERRIMDTLLDQSPPRAMRSSELAKATGIPRSTFQEALSKLKAGGYVEGDREGRIVLYRVTEEGAQWVQ